MLSGESRVGLIEDKSMANRNFPSQKMFGMHLMPVKLDSVIAIGASGAPSILNGVGIASVTRLSAGIYQIQLQDNYPALSSIMAKMESPTAGADVLLPALSVGSIYQITVLGAATTAQWIAAGVPAGIAPAVGVVFKAAATSAGAASAARLLGPSGISAIEVLGDSNTMLSVIPSTPLLGGYITIACYAATSSSVTTLIPTDPLTGSKLIIGFMLNNSQVQ